MKIYESSEDYLEAILMLQERLGSVRSIDVVGELSVSKPSVSVAMKKLRENGYIKMDADGFLTLEPKGLAIAEKIYERHRTLTECFLRLGVSEETARRDACRVEHDLSDETFEKIKHHLLDRGQGES